MNVKLETNFWVQYFLAPELQVFVSSLKKLSKFHENEHTHAVFDLPCDLI